MLVRACQPRTCRPIHNNDQGTAITFTEPIPDGFDALHINAVPVQVDQISATTVHLPDTTVPSDAQVTVSKLEGDVKTIIQHFNNEWAPRWNKPAHDMPGKWDTIVAFMQAAVPKRQADFPAITIDSWRKEVKRKRNLQR